MPPTNVAPNSVSVGSTTCPPCLFDEKIFLLPCMHVVCDNHADQTFEKLKRGRPIVCAFCKESVKYMQQQVINTPGKYPISADLARARIKVTAEALPPRFQHYAKNEQPQSKAPVVQVSTPSTELVKVPEKPDLLALQEEGIILEALHTKLTAHCAKKLLEKTDNINNPSSVARDASLGASPLGVDFFTAHNNTDTTRPLLFAVCSNYPKTLIPSHKLPLEFFQAGDLTESTEDLASDSSAERLLVTKVTQSTANSLPDFKFPLPVTEEKALGRSSLPDFKFPLTSTAEDSTTSEKEPANMLRSQRLSDPFDDHSFHSPQTPYNAINDGGRGDYSHFSMSSGTREVAKMAATGSPARRSASNGTPLSADHVRTASELSDLIRKGGVEANAGALAGRHSSQSSMSSTSLARMGTIVNHSGLLMVDAIQDPPFFDELQSGNVVSVEDVLDYVPLVEPSRQFRPSNAGVIVIKNIPYATLKNEVIAAIGRSAKIVSQPPGTSYHAIHIIMERASGKTMDAFVEVETHADAVSIVDTYTQRVAQRRGPRIGNRHVEIAVSSQEQLMQTLFPRARSMTWQGQEPCIEHTGDEFSSGFLGFLTQEEITMLVKHAEVPQRSPFAQRCLHRTYESMISTLWKYPWFAPEHVTVKERVMLFDVACGLLKALMRQLRGDTNRQTSSASLNIELLQELCCAVMNVPFSTGQKDHVMALMTEYTFDHVVDSVRRSDAGLFSTSWPFEALDKKDGVSIEVLQYYVGLLNKSAPAPQLSLAQRSVLGRSQRNTSPFGLFTIDYATTKLGELTLAAVAQYEWHAVERALRKALRSESQSLIENLENLALTHDQASVSRGRSTSDFMPSAVPKVVSAQEKRATRTVSASAFVESPGRQSASPSTPPRRAGQDNPHLSPAQKLMLQHCIASSPMRAQKSNTGNTQASNQGHSPLMWQLQPAVEHRPLQAAAGAGASSPSSSGQDSDDYSRSIADRNFNLHGLGHNIGVSPPVNRSRAGNPSIGSNTSSTHSFHTAYSEELNQKTPIAGLFSIHDGISENAGAATQGHPQKTFLNPAAAEFPSLGMTMAQPASKKATLNPSAATFSSDFSTWGPIGGAVRPGASTARSWADAAKGPK